MEENKGGRPRIYESPESMQEIIDEYFVYVKGEEGLVDNPLTGEKEMEWIRPPEPITITGLILYLGFGHREALIDYEKREGFSDIVKRARLRVENAYEKRLMSNSPTGPIFALKNMGWKDKVETGLTDKDGNDRDVVIFQLPDNGRDPHHNTPAGLPDSSTEQQS